MIKLRFLLLLLFFINSVILKSQGEGVEIKVDLEEAYQKGIALMSANQYAKAIDHIFECQRTDPNNLDYLNRLGYCYFQLGNYQEAKYAFKDLLKKDSLHISALSNLAAIAKQELNYNSASHYYNQLIEIDSTNSYYYRQNALVAQKKGDIILATAFFNKAHTLNETDISTINDLALMYLELKALEYAQQIIDKGMAIDSSNIRVLHTNARIRNALDDYPSVIRSIERAMEQGDSTNYYAMMISVAYLKIDSLDLAIYQLEEIVKRQKDSEHTHHYLGMAYELKGAIKKASEHFEKAIEKGISKKVPRYHQDLAALYEKDKQYYKAYENYKAAYSYHPKKELLFHIAHTADLYYKDKNIAMRYYKKYSNTNDKKYQTYSTQRMKQLKEIIHQMK